VRVDGAERIRFPFRVSGIPTSLRLYGSSVTMSTSPGPGRAAWGAGITFSDRPDGLAPDRQKSRMLMVGVYPGRLLGPGGNSTWGGLSATVDGHHAKVLREPGTDYVHVFEDWGQKWAWAIDSATVQALGPAGATGIYRRMTLVTEPDNMDNWTDRPLR
jgi:hypothetical protein